MDQHQVSEECRGDVLVDAIKEKLRSLSPLSTDCCIYRVPEKLRKFNPEAYSPRAVSIGPLHHGDEELRAMEEHKLRYLQSFIPRTTLSIEELVEISRTWEEKARNCYAETLKLSSDDFVMMLIVDGSFLVELFLRSGYPDLIGENDRIFHKPKMIDDVCRDLILLENQLPGFVVKGMFQLLSVYYQEGICSLPDLMYHHFNCFLRLGGGFSRDSEPDHFLDLLRSCYVPAVPDKFEVRVMKRDTAPAAAELHDAGVEFMPRNKRRCALDIDFANGVLKIPRIIIDDITETLYRNIIAFEQCHCTDKYFIHYALLLSCLIKSPTDADLLIRRGILLNYLGNSEDVSRLFNSICREVVFGNTFYFQALSEDLYAHRNRPQNKWKAALRRDYFGNPWSVASVLAAVALLLLTLIQAVCSILAL